MPWEERNIMSERMCFVSRLEGGERMTDLCREYGISRKTGYKFWDRYRRFGPMGLYYEPRSPISIPHRTTEELRKRIIEWKEKHLTWGAKKIKAELQRSQKGLTLPSYKGHVQSELCQEIERRKPELESS